MSGKTGLNTKDRERIDKIIIAVLPDYDRETNRYAFLMVR